MAQLRIDMVPDSLRHRYLRPSCAVYCPSLCMTIGHHSLIETCPKLCRLLAMSLLLDWLVRED